MQIRPVRLEEKVTARVDCEDFLGGSRCPCGGVFAGWKRGRAEGGGARELSRSRLFSVYFTRLPLAAVGGLAFRRVLSSRVWLRAAHGGRAPTLYFEKCWPGYRHSRDPVIRGDVGGEYFQITRHFRLDVARFIRYVRATTFYNAHVHKFTHAAEPRIHAARVKLAPLSLSLSDFLSSSLFSLVLSSAIVLSVARYVNVPLFYVTLQNGFSTARPQHDNQKRARRTVNRFFDAIKRTPSRWLARAHPENSPSNFQMKSRTIVSRAARATRISLPRPAVATTVVLSCDPSFVVIFNSTLVRRLKSPR